MFRRQHTAERFAPSAQSHSHVRYRNRLNEGRATADHSVSRFTLNIGAFHLPPALRRGEADSVFRFRQQPTANWHLASFGGRSFTAAITVDHFDRGGCPGGSGLLLGLISLS